MPAGVSPNGSLNVAGILGPDDKLTTSAKDRFITEVENELRFGTPDIAFPCGDRVLPDVGSAIVDLHNAELYPAFHANWVGRYEAIAVALNLPRGPGLFLPFVDITVGLPKIPNIDFNLLLNLMPLGIDLPKLVIDLGKIGIDIDLPTLQAILNLPLLKLPNFAVNIPLPSIDLPSLRFKIELLLKLPDLMLSFALPDFCIPPKFPDLQIKICEKIRRALFKSEYDDERKGVDTTDIAASLVLSRNVAKLMALTAVCAVVGSGGIVNVGVAGALGLTEQPKPPEPTPAATFYDLDQDEFWDHYVMMCNRLEIDPPSLAQIFQFEGQWTPFKRNLQGSKAMGFIQIMPWIYKGSNVSNDWVRGLRMRPEYWQALYDENPIASRHASDDLFWTEQFFINGVMGATGRTLAEFRGKPVKLYDYIINPQLNKIPPSPSNPNPQRFNGASVNPAFKNRIDAAMLRVGQAKGKRLPQPDGLRSAFIDWNTVSQDDIVNHPIYASNDNKQWWHSLPESDEPVA